MRWNHCYSTATWRHIAFPAAALTFALITAPLRADQTTAGQGAVEKDICPGIVLMKTSPHHPTIIRGSIGYGLLDTGSDQMLDAEIILQGEPLATKAGTPSLEGADTVIELEDGVNFTESHPTDVSVYYRVKALNLASVEPLTVTYQSRNPELWDVRVCISSLQPAPFEGDQGVMQFTNDCDTAGTFTSMLIVRAKFIFKRQRDGKITIVDQDKIDPLLFISHGFWSNRSFSTAEFPEVAAGAVVDADCDGTFETTLPATAPVILGLERVNCNAGAPTQGREEIRSVIHDRRDVILLDPVTRDDRALGAVPASHVSGSRALWALGGLAVLGIASLVIQPRRKPGKDRD